MTRSIEIPQLRPTEQYRVRIGGWRKDKLILQQWYERWWSSFLKEPIKDKNGGGQWIDVHPSEAFGVQFQVVVNKGLDNV